MSFAMAYVWQDLDAPEAEQKFGDHFSEADTLEEAVTETQKYIRGTLGRQKHKFKEGRVVIHQIWDVTEYAKLKNRFGKHQKIDDVIRPVIGHHVGADVHRIDAETLIIRVNKELSKHGQPLPEAGLSTLQFNTAVDVVEQIEAGKQIIVAELCARFGKTIWSGALIRELNRPLNIVASYVLTSFTSFIKDLTAFEQFKDLVHVDTKDDDFKEQVEAALNAGKQVIAYVSMCKGGKRDGRVETLYDVDADRLLIVDEADFGVHKAGQADLLIDNQREGDVVVLMTGTNSDRAATLWNPDYMVSVTYPELLMEKSLTLNS